MHEIRVIAPSDSWKPDREESYAKAGERLEQAGYSVSFGKNVTSLLHLDTAPAKLRAEDFNNAFADPHVSAVLALHGGFSVNEILPLIDWQVVQDNPKPFIGYSDNTVLVNAIYAKTGAPAFLGPNFGSLGRDDLWEYSLNGVLQVLRNEQPLTLAASKTYVDNETIHTAKPWHTIQSGIGTGILLGGNIQSFFLLQGTAYQPRFDQDYVLAIEDDSLSGAYTLHGLARNLESLLQLPGARRHIRGIMIGRFEHASLVKTADLESVMRTKDLDIPIVSNVDFGHTAPLMTLPIGGTVALNAHAKSSTITVVSY